MTRIRYKIGIDEVGRGPLAGPVTVAAFLMPANDKLPNNKRAKLRDSKKLSEKQRNEWDSYLRNNKKYNFAIVSFSPKKIDKYNISKSANLCAQKALLRLAKKIKTKNLHKKAKIYLDGGLYVGEKGSSIGKTIIKGDEKISVISAASILAKVYRDKLMNKYALKFAGFNFDLNKGYGTAHHIKILKRKGATSIHRKTFISNFV